MSFRSFQHLATHAWKFRLFMLMKLPSAFFSGVSVRSLTEDSAVVSVPYKWFSQNPFKSTYFACQSMAAEMASGLLALGNIYQRRPSVSMLVTRMESEFQKKATERVYFTCTDGALIRECIDKAIATGEGQTCIATSTGRTKSGEQISVFRVQWSFKAKQGR